MNIQSILAFCSLLCIYAIRETTSASLEIVSYYINLSSLAIRILQSMIAFHILTSYIFIKHRDFPENLNNSEYTSITEFDL